MTKTTNYDYSKLPNNPFAIYFINARGEVFPKKMFTATRKRINDQSVVEIYILELSRFIEYKANRIAVVHNFHLN